MSIEHNEESSELLELIEWMSEAGLAVKPCETPDGEWIFFIVLATGRELSFAGSLLEALRKAKESIADQINS